MKTRPATGARAGFTLLECMIYLGVFCLLVSLAIGAFYHVLENSTQLNHNAADITRVLQAGERWREDVRTAHAPVRFTEIEGKQVLCVPRVGGGAIQYAWHNETVWRQPGTNSAWKPFLRGVKSSRMELDQRAQLSAWRWELELKTTQKVARVKPLFTFVSVAPDQEKP